MLSNCFLSVNPKMLKLRDFTITLNVFRNELKI